MTAPTSSSAAAQRLLGPAFDTLTTGLALVGAPSAVGKTCVSLSLAAHYAGHLGESVLYFSPGTPAAVVLTRLAKNLLPEGAVVDPSVAEKLPLTVIDEPDLTSAQMIDLAAAYVERHGQPAIVLVNDLQSILPGKEGMTGLAAAIEIMADMRAIAKLCDAPLVLFSQLASGKGVSSSVAEQADRVITVSLASETPEYKYLQMGYFDPPEPAAESYSLRLIRSTGVVSMQQ